MKIGRFHAWRAFNGYQPENERELAELQAFISENIDRRQLFPNRVLDIDTTLRASDDSWEFRGWIDSNSQIVGGELIRNNNGTLLWRSTGDADRIETDVDLVGDFTVAGVFSGEANSQTFHMSSNDNNINRFAVFSNMRLAFLDGEGSSALLDFNSPSPVQPLNSRDWFFVCLVREGNDSKAYVKSSKGEFEYELDLSDMTSNIENLQFMNFHSQDRATIGMGFYAGFAATSPYTKEQVEDLFQTYQSTVPALPQD